MENQSNHKRCTVVAEVAQAHDGSLGTAHAYVDAAARAGADAIKFQTHLAAAESSPQEPWRVKFSPQDSTRYEYWQRTSFSEEQWAGLRNHAREAGLAFISSPFSLEAAEMLSRIGVDVWKVASGEAANTMLLEYMAATGKPVYLSTGMSHLDEIDRATGYLRQQGVEHCVFQCTSAYPCPPEQVGLNLLSEFRQRYQCEVGLSDHSGTIFPGLAAVTLGAKVIEVHITLSRECFGPDVVASITTAELKQLVEGVRFIDSMMRSPVEKDLAARELEPMRRLFTKSVVARQDLAAGSVLREDHLTLKKPGTGIPGDRLRELVGRRLSRGVVSGQILEDADIAPLVTSAV